MTYSQALAKALDYTSNKRLNESLDLTSNYYICVLTFKPKYRNRRDFDLIKDEYRKIKFMHGLWSCGGRLIDLKFITLNKKDQDHWKLVTFFVSNEISLSDNNDLIKLHWYAYTSLGNIEKFKIIKKEMIISKASIGFAIDNWRN